MKEYKHFKIRGFKTLENGFFFQTGKKWILLKDNPFDFILDGFLCIRKKHVLREVALDNSLKNAIFNLKRNSQKKEHLIDINLNDDSRLFNYFIQTDSLIQVCLARQDSTLVGKPMAANENSFRMRLLSTKGKWLNEFNFKYDQIRTINFESDYLKSFQLYLKQ